MALASRADPHGTSLSVCWARDPHASPLPGDDRERHSWGETFHLHIEVTANGGPTPGSSRLFQVRSVSRGTGCAAGRPGKRVPSPNPRSPAFLGPGRQAAVPGSGSVRCTEACPFPLVFRLDTDPPGPLAACASQPLAGKEFLTWHKAKQVTKTKFDT